VVSGLLLREAHGLFSPFCHPGVVLSALLRIFLSSVDG
jgi:hypothetical protein